MAKKHKPLRHDESGKEVTLDIHGYRVREAVAAADRIVRDAWEAGCDSVQLIHGVPDVTSKEQADAGGRGGIKVELRDRLARGDWSAYVEPNQDANHCVEGGAVTVKLRPNPAPSKDKVSRRGLPKPKRKQYFRGRQEWAAAKESVQRDYPLLAEGEARFPELVARCRTALTRETLLARSLEIMRQRAEYERIPAYLRMHRKWQTTRIRAESLLEELRSQVRPHDDVSCP